MSEHLIAALAPITSRVRTDVTAIKNANGVAWAKGEALTKPRLLAHLNGGTARGVCPIKAGERTTMVGLFDLDSHGGQSTWEEMAAAAEAVCGALERAGCYPVSFRSSGGRGIHIYVIWDAPQDAYSVRVFLKTVLESVGFKNGTAGVHEKKIEVFPKQSFVAPGKLGSQFFLPLAGKSELLEPLLGFEPVGRDAALSAEWRGSAPVPVVEPPVYQEPAMPENLSEHLQKLASALAHLKTDTMGYAEWLKVIFALHHDSEGSEAGFALADAFSKRFSTYDYDELRAFWDNSGRHEGAGVTGASILFEAREAGWNDVSADDFEALPAVVSGAHDLSAAVVLPMGLQRDKQSRVEATVNNLAVCLADIAVSGMEIRFDEFQFDVVFCERGEPGVWQSFGETEYFRLRRRLEAQGFKPIGRELIRDAVRYVAKTNPLDTAISWLEGLAWDGVQRVDGFLETYFTLDDIPSDYARAVSAYWWTAMAGRVLRPGCQADMSPILISPKQGMRKSSAVAAMVPPDAHRVFNFNQSEDNRSRLMRGCLAAELAELHGLNTKAKEEIRAWLTKRSEAWVPKFEEKSVAMPRRCIFVGTSNPTELFGEFERRWLPVQLKDEVDIEGIERDRDQLWAEAREKWRSNGIAWRDAERLLEGVQGRFRAVDTWEDALRQWLVTGEAGTRPVDVGFTLREALVEALGFTDKTTKRTDETRAATALRLTGMECKVVWREGKSARRWVPGPQFSADLA